MSVKHSGQSHPSFIEGLWTGNKKLLEKDMKQVPTIIINICELSTYSVLNSGYPHLRRRKLPMILTDSGHSLVSRDVIILLTTHTAIRQPHETGTTALTSHVENTEGQGICNWPKAMQKLLQRSQNLNPELPHLKSKSFPLYFAASRSEC